jgi:solute carrier family 13 (sodium-dependent dicarboxylate transporter), member 2/3/5
VRLFHHSPAADDVGSAGLSILSRRSLQWAGLAAGPIAAWLVYVSLPTDELTDAGRATAAVAAWMAVWWLTEAVEIPVTALLPVLLFPLVGATTIREATAPYANELIFLFLGGFVLALSMQRWGLDERIALITLRLVGDRPRNIIGGFMLATAVMSMWVSNTATVAMMVPIALSVADLIDRIDPDSDAHGSLTVPLLLGVAYSASIGGMGTIIGTPPNLFVASFITERFGVEVTFLDWMLLAMPLVVVFLPLGWWLLTRWLHRTSNRRIPGAATHVRERLHGLGRPHAGEIITVAVFSVTALAWITRPLLTELELFGFRPLAGITDTGIAVAAAIALFVIPAEPRTRVFTMDWETARRIPWGILLLFGGGLSLAAALDANGVAAYLGSQAEGLAGLPTVVVVFAVATVVVWMTELTSNTATTATLAPIMAGIAVGIGIDPILLVVPVALAASAAFMMPVATPPNAIVFGSGRIEMPDMIRAGIWMNLVSMVLVTVTVMVMAPLVFGI